MANPLSRMRLVLPIIALLMISSGAWADTSELTPFTAGYEGSVSLGSLKCEISLSRETDGTYTFKSTSHAIGFAAMFFKDVITETSHFEIVDGRPRSLEYSYVRTGGKHDKSETIQFDWRKSLATTVENGKTVATPISAGVADRFLTQLILSYDTAAGKLQDSYRVLDHRDISHFSPKRLPDKTFSVPAGEFATVAVERQDEGSKRVLDFWFAPKLDYQPTKIQQREPGEDTYTLTLSSIKFDTSAPAATTK